MAPKMLLIKSGSSKLQHLQFTMQVSVWWRVLMENEWRTLMKFLIFSHSLSHFVWKHGSISKICFLSLSPCISKAELSGVQNIQVANSWMKSTWPGSPHISIQDTTRRQPSTLQLTSPDCICWRVPDQEIQPQFHNSSLVKKMNSRLSGQFVYCLDPIWIYSENL